jgi:hypothetical protein
MQVQANWRLCGLCFGLFFGGHAGKGRCPEKSPIANTTFGFTHVTDIKSTFLVLFEDQTVLPNAQDKWAWCRKCEGMYFNGHGTRGRCPAGQQHDVEGSGKYRMFFGVGKQPNLTIDGNWRWCWKCEGMFFRSPGVHGVCPAGGGHDSRKSGIYDFLLPGPKAL